MKHEISKTTFTVLNATWAIVGALLPSIIVSVLIERTRPSDEIVILAFVLLIASLCTMALTSWMFRRFYSTSD